MDWSARSVVPKDAAGRCGDGEGVRGRGSDLGHEDTSNVGVFGVVGIGI